jgi:hypothetical protein
MPDWLLQSLLARVVWEMLLIFGVGTVLGYLKAKMPELAPRILYGLAGATCVATLLFAFTGRAVFSKEPPETTVDNVEQNVRSWLDWYGVGVTKRSTTDEFFAFSVTMRSGNVLGVARPKDRDRYLILRTSLTSDLTSVIDKMNDLQKARLGDEVMLEMARSRATYHWDPPSGGMDIMKIVPISSALTQDTFASRVEELDAEIELARESVRLSIDRNRPIGSRRN